MDRHEAEQALGDFQGKLQAALVSGIEMIVPSLSAWNVFGDGYPGFLVAMLAYQLADTHDHRHVFGVAWLTGFVVLAGAYFVLKNLFYAAGSVGVIIEIIGGGFFLTYILRKGRL